MAEKVFLTNARKWLLLKKSWQDWFIFISSYDSWNYTTNRNNMKENSLKKSNNFKKIYKNLLDSTWFWNRTRLAINKRLKYLLLPDHQLPEKLILDFGLYIFILVYQVLFSLFLFQLLLLHDHLKYCFLLVTLFTSILFIRFSINLPNQGSQHPGNPGKTLEFWKILSPGVLEECLERWK